MNDEDGTSVDLTGRRILIVEDDWLIADALASLLQGLGMIVEGPVTNVAAAEKVFASMPLQLAVVDLNLNGERADNLVTRLAGEGVRVVVVSAYDAAQMETDKAFSTLQKPVQVSALLREIRRACADLDAA